MKYWIRERSFVEKHNKNGSEIFQIDLVFTESNRIESNLELWLSRLWTSVWTEVSTKPLSKSGSRGRVGHKARSRENLRMAFLEASPLGSRITSRIAVIISRGRGSECGAGFGGGVTNNSAHETLPPAPSPPLIDGPPTDKNLEPSNFFAAKPALAFRPATRLVYVLKKLIKSTTKLPSPRVIRFQIILEFFENELRLGIFIAREIRSTDNSFPLERIPYHIGWI